MVTSASAGLPSASSILARNMANCTTILVLVGIGVHFLSLSEVFLCQGQLVSLQEDVTEHRQGDAGGFWQFPPPEDGLLQHLAGYFLAAMQLPSDKDLAGQHTSDHQQHKQVVLSLSCMEKCCQLPFEVIWSLS